MKLGSLAPWRDRGAVWWSGRSQREQLLLSTLAVVGIVALLMIAVVRPLEAARARAVADIRTYDMLALRLRAAGPMAGAGAPARRGPPASIVAASAGATGVTVQRVEPEGGRLTVVLADAAFDNVVRFVADLERTSGLRIAEARIEASTTGPGLVTAHFILAGL